MRRLEFLYRTELPYRAKAVYLYLYDRSNADGQCYPAINTIARELGMSRSTVKRAITDLMNVSMLKKEQRYRSNGGCSSLLFSLSKPE